MLPVPYYRKKEEILNVISHGFGLLLSLIGFLWLLFKAVASDSIWYTLSIFIYGISLIILYGASTSYHYAYAKRIRRILNKVDHSAIYLLIAGTYTPFCLIALRDSVGWWLFVLIWALAITGFIFKIKTTGKYNFLSTVLYILMGWMVVFTFRPLINSISVSVLVFLILGGGAYTIGAIFYLLKRLPYHHAVFHLWVLAGSIFHYISIAQL